MRKISLLFLGCLLLAGVTAAQEPPKVYPANWWTGMKYPRLQVMVHGQDIGNAAAVSVSCPGVRLIGWHRVASSNYLFLQLQISAAAKPGLVMIRVDPKGKGRPALIRYPLLARRSGRGRGFAKGVTSADFIYFLMPDRFSNGDPANDRVPGMRDQIAQPRFDVFPAWG